MLGIHKIRNSIPRNALFTSIDISNVFYHILIHPRFQKFLTFSHNSQLYSFRAMTFGIKLGPLIFTKVISELATQEAPQRPRLCFSLHQRLDPLEQISLHPRQKHGQSYLSLKEPWLQHELDKVPANTPSNNHLPRHSVGRANILSYSQPPEHRANHRSSSGSPAGSTRSFWGPSTSSLPSCT